MNLFPQHKFNDYITSLCIHIDHPNKIDVLKCFIAIILLITWKIILIFNGFVI